MSPATVRRLWLVLVLAACGTGCSHSPNAPSDPTINGTWVAADRSFTWHLTQSGLAVTGSHVAAGQQPVAIAGTMIGREFSFRVVTGQRLVTFLDPPELVDVGWSVRADVEGNQMTGSITSMGSPGRTSIDEITMRRVDADR